MACDVLPEWNRARVADGEGEDPEERPSCRDPLEPPRPGGGSSSSSGAALDNAFELIRIKRRRDAPAADDIEWQRRRISSAKRPKEDLLSCFANMKLEEGRKFSASYSGGTFTVRKKRYRRVATVHKQELKDVFSTACRLHRLIRDARAGHQRVSCMDHRKVRNTTERQREDAEKTRQMLRYSQFREFRKSRSSLDTYDRKTLLEKFLDLYKNVCPSRSSRSTAEILKRAAEDPELTEDQRNILQRFAPMVRDHLVNDQGMTKEDAMKACTDANDFLSNGNSPQANNDDFVYDVYIPVEGGGLVVPPMPLPNPSGFLNFCDAGYFDEDSGYGTEDSNAEDWYGNDYPDEEEDGTDGRSSKDCESDSKGDSDHSGDQGSGGMSDWENTTEN